MSQKLEETYRVGEGPVFLTVTIGNGQMGSSAVFIGDVEEPQVVGDEVVQANLGNGPDLVTSEVFVKSVVADVNDLTNRTVVTYDLEGGPEPKSYQLDEIVENDGDSTVFRATFTFEL